MKSVLLMATLLGLSAQAQAAEVLCVTPGGIKDVNIRISSSKSLLDVGADVVIATQGMLSTDYTAKVVSIKPFGLNGGKGAEIHMSADIAPFTFSPEIPRVIEAVLTVQVGANSSGLTVEDSTSNKLELIGDLTDTQPRLHSSYTLNGCSGAL